MLEAEGVAACWFLEQVGNFDAYIHGARSILFSAKTTYQHMYIVETPTLGKALFLDSKIQSATADEFLYHEALVHPACLASGSPKKVLVLGGGEGAALREVLRWRTVERALMVDIDQEVVEACKENLPEMHSGAFTDARTELVFVDALVFFKNNAEKWDVVISDLTEPIERGPSYRLFTKEFFQQAKDSLRPGGLFVLQAGPIGPQYIESYSRLSNTVRAVFPYTLGYQTSVPSYPSPWGFILGSTNPLDSRPHPEVVDELLRKRTSGGFRMLDGEALLGLLQTPLYIREAIKREKRIFTLSEPPIFFGRGNAE